MKVPFQCLLVRGEILLAAQGDSIHAFDQGLNLLSTWRHPGKLGEVKKENGSKGPVTEGEKSPAADGPPSKRRKLEDGAQEAGDGEEEAGDEDEGQTADATADAASDQLKAESKRSKKRKNKQKGTPPSRQGTVSAPSERPFVLSLNSTNDGRYVVAVTGSDKAIWVFEHDGRGHLKQLSQRVMPKRPSSLCLTLDEETILCADKFGDVYALPLIPKNDPPIAPSAEQKQVSGTPPPSVSSRATPQPFKPQANETTVHLKRNLVALQNQLKAREAAPPKEVPTFEHTLLLGHVSMLTGVLVLKDAATGRPYILTADRDEHIRVSRGVLSQAYIIDHFCFGHEDFISRLCAVPGRPELLLSAGGDDEVFLWNWTKGNLLAKKDVLAYVREISPSAEKIAVSGLYAHVLNHDGEHATWVFLFCEGVPAIFCFKITESSDLEFTERVSLSGKPLDMAWAEHGPGGLLVSVDTNHYPAQSGDKSGESSDTNGKEAAGSSLQVLKRQESGWRAEDVTLHLGVSADSAIDVKPDELQKALYTVENLRKYGLGEDS